MKLSKKAAVLSATYIAAGFLLLVGFLIQSEARSEQYKRKIDVNYDHAFSELTTAMEELDVALKRARYVSSPAMMSAVCAQAYAKAMGADSALSSLPYGNINLEHTAAFIAKTGDYLYFLSKSSASGRQLSQEERDNLASLSESAAVVSDTLGVLQAMLLTGGASLQELQQAESQISRQEEAISDTGLAASFKRMESEFPELPSLIYDGPFSQHIENALPRYLKDMKDITEEEALEAAASFLGDEKGGYSVQYLREGSIPVYVVTKQDGGHIHTLEISKAGGQVLYFGTSRPAGKPVVSPQDAVETAKHFLEQQGFQNMRLTYWEQEAGELVANFAYEQDGVICYPDLIKVTVSLDTGSPRGFESLGYMMCHATRDLQEPEISRQEAREKVLPDLSIKSQALTVIPTSGENEVLCHEFLCQDSEGGRCLIYINAHTGAEEKILLLLESENGTLTI